MDGEPTRNISGGLDLLQLDGVTAEEVAAFAEFYISRHGREHLGFSYLLHERPDALKAFRLYVRAVSESSAADENMFSVGPAYFLYYAHLGYHAGVRDVFGSCQGAGYSKEDCRDLFGLGALVLGPAGFETLARALADHLWIDQTSTIRVPANWDRSLDALEAGLDFSELRLLPGERELIERWYDLWLGEVPAWVRFAGDHQPNVLKVQRLRFERALRSLPKQTLPLAMLNFRLMRGDVETIRENVLMARGFGVSKDQVLRTIVAAVQYGGEETIAVAAAKVADVIADWPSS
jgi:hypothetical protein